MAVVTALRKQKVALLSEQDKLIDSMRKEFQAEKESERKQIESAYETQYVPTTV